MVYYVSLYGILYGIHNGYPCSKPIIILYVNGLWSFHNENPHTGYTNPCEKRVTNPQYVDLQSHLTKKTVDIHTYIPTYLSDYLSIYLSNYLSIYLSIYRSI